MSGSMSSNVGNRQIYEDGDQRNVSRDAEGPASHESATMKLRNAHDVHDPRDDRTLNNRAKQEKQMEKEEESQSHTVTNPLEPAERQGHEPSRGAQVDAELQREDEEMLKKKGPYHGMAK